MKIIKLIKSENREQFLLSLGDFFTQREVHDELGEPMYNTDNMVWFVAIEEEKPVGFTSYSVKDKTIKFAWSYVIPELRRNGIYKQLWEARQNDISTIEHDTIKTTCRIVLKEWFLDNGFTITKEWKNYFNAEKK